MPFSNLLDRAIFTVFPRWGARRMALRRMWEASEKLAERRRKRAERGSTERHGGRSLHAWEGAEQDRHRASSWLASRLSPDSALEESLETLRLRSQELSRNDPWVASYLRGLVSYVVGRGRRPQARILPWEGSSGSVSEAEAQKLNDQLESVYRRWERTAGIHGETYAQIQQRLARNRAKDGDVFVILRDVGRADSPIPLALEIVTAERVETPPSQAGNVNVRLGIERDSRGNVVAIHVRKTHPGDTLNPSEEYERVPVFDRSGRRRVLHHWKPSWEGQSRGVPDVEPVLNDLKDLDDLWQAQIIRQQVQASFALFIETQTEAQEIAEAAASETTSAGKRLEEIQPGIIEYLNRGEKMTFAQPQGEDNLDPFMRWRLRAIASGLNWSYELLVHHWENSYAGGRLSLIDAQKRITDDAQLLDWQVNEPLWEQIVVESLIVGELDLDPRIFREDPARFTGSQWLGDPLPWIDPLVEIEAAAKAEAFGFDDLQNILIARGLDPETFWRQRAETRKRKKEAGIPELIPAGWTTVAMAEAQAAHQGPAGTGKPVAPKEPEENAASVPILERAAV